MTLKDLAKEGWIISTSVKDSELTQDQIDELVYRTWGWASKLRVKNIQENPYLIERVNSINFDEVFEMCKQRQCHSS